MRVLGVSFSGRQHGNCDRCLGYCLEQLAAKDADTAAVYIREHPVRPCTDCEYACFSGALCPIHDSMDDIFDQCDRADVILWALPAYRGHLPSAYFAFSERLEGYVQRGVDIEATILKKAHIILIGNSTAGADTARDEVLADFGPFSPAFVMLSSRDYHRRSIDGDMIEAEPVRQELDRFIQSILNHI